MQLQGCKLGVVEQTGPTGVGEAVVHGTILLFSVLACLMSPTIAGWQGAPEGLIRTWKSRCSTVVCEWMCVAVGGCLRVIVAPSLLKATKCSVPLSDRMNFAAMPVSASQISETLVRPPTMAMRPEDPSAPGDAELSLVRGVFAAQPASWAPSDQCEK